MNRVVAAGEFDAAVDEWAVKLASKSPVMMRLGKDAMYRQLDMPLRRRARLPALAALAGVHDRGHPGGRHGLLREARAGVDGPMTRLARRAAAAAPPTARPGAVRGAQTLAPLIGKRLGLEPRTIGTPAEPRATRYDEDLRDSRGCLLEAGGQVDDALAGGRVPVLAAADCSISVTTLPAALRHRPDAKVLWLDAPRRLQHPARRPGSGYLGGMCLAGALRRVGARARRGDRPPEQVVLAGVRDLDSGERELLERSAATVIGASASRDARGGRRTRSTARPSSSTSTST